ncbi:MAG: NF038122 family metalloprotease [Microcoleaceae cyanobacterium]
MNSKIYCQSGCNPSTQAQGLIQYLARVAPKALLGWMVVALGSVPAQALDIQATYSTGVTDEQKVAFELASAIWEDYLVDEVTVNLYIDLVGDELLPENVLGGSLPAMLTGVNFQDFDSALNSDITSGRDRTAHANMSTDDESYHFLSDEGEEDDAETSSSELNMTYANAKALGLIDANASGFDGYIGMNQNFNWSYDFFHSPGGDEIDFLSVALHEIGHQLGFVSSVDDFASNSGQEKSAQTLDLFRYSETSLEEGVADLTTNGEAKFLSINGTQAVATDGLQAYSSFSSCQGVSLAPSQCRVAEFSTGKGEDADGYQASHWKQQEYLGTNKTIGVMDPAIGYGMTRSITALDLVAFDVIGWNTTQRMRDGISAGEMAYDLVTLFAQAEQQAAEAMVETIDTNGNGVDDRVEAMVQDSEVYNHCLLFPWRPGCSGSTGGWQELLQANLLAQEVILVTEPEKVPEPTIVVGLLGFGALSLIAGGKRSRNH